MMDKYILEGRTPKAVADLIEWARWFEKADRHVARDEINGILVSTVFLGLDHGWGMHSRPVLFETMVFGGKYDQSQERYCTWDEAEAGHKQWLKKVQDSEEWPSEIEQ
jgi:hypothetical protein